MKFSKLILMGGALLLSTSLIAEEIKKDWAHTSYLAYESRSQGISMPSLGYRFQDRSLIFDVNVGYKHMGADYFTLHVGKVGGNIYKIIDMTEKGQWYAGIGVDLIGLEYKPDKKIELEWRPKKRSYIIHPSLSIGYDFLVDENTKIFLEISYTPYSFTNEPYISTHLTGCRMGIGF